jgi:predicted nucleic acid-binding protein
MPFFVDANVIVYTAGAGRYGDACRDVLRAISEGNAEGVTSTAAIEEVWHIELSGKTGDVSGLTQDAYTMFRPLLAVTDETVARALALEVQGLGANDRIHVATCLENGIDTIVSADAELDGVRGIRRVDPLDGRAVARLLQG